MLTDLSSVDNNKLPAPKLFLLIEEIQIFESLPKKKREADGDGFFIPILVTN